MNNVAQDLLERAIGLLANASPSKVLNTTKSEEWCKAFGRWYAEAYPFVHPHPQDTRHRESYWWMPKRTDPINSGWLYVRQEPGLNMIGIRYFDALDGSWWAVQRGEKTLVPNETFKEWLTLPGISDNQWTS